LVGKAKLTDIVVGQGRPTGRQEKVAIAFDKMVGADQLDPKPRSFGKDVHFS
jgi:hypothetical protein